MPVKGRWHLYGWRSVMSCHLIFRAAGAGGLQRAGKRLWPGLWSLPASSPGRPGPLLYLVPPRLPECTGLRMDLHLVVSWSISSETQNCFFFILHIMSQLRIHLSWQVAAEGESISKTLKVYYTYLEQYPDFYCTRKTENPAQQLFGVEIYNINVCKQLPYPPFLVCVSQANITSGGQ